MLIRQPVQVQLSVYISIFLLLLVFAAEVKPLDRSHNGCAPRVGFELAALRSGGPGLPCAPCVADGGWTGTCAPFKPASSHSSPRTALLRICGWLTLPVWLNVAKTKGGITAGSPSRRAKTEPSSRPGTFLNFYFLACVCSH